SIECLSLVRYRLPAAALDALNAASGYLSARVSLEEINVLVIECWQQLDGAYKGKDVDVPDVSAIRAAIFVLDSLEHPQDTDIFNRLQYFLQFINNVEPRLQEYAALLNRYFPDV